MDRMREENSAGVISGGISERLSRTLGRRGYRADDRSCALSSLKGSCKGFVVGRHGEFMGIVLSHAERSCVNIGSTSAYRYLKLSIQ